MWSKPLLSTIVLLQPWKSINIRFCCRRPFFQTILLFIMEIFTHLQNIHSTHTIDPQRQLELSINISKLLDWPTKDSDTAPRIASTLPGPCWLRRNYECEEVSCFFFSFTRPIQWLVCHSFVVHRKKIANAKWCTRKVLPVWRCYQKYTTTIVTTKKGNRDLWCC